jgi:hypothetical protein
MTDEPRDDELLDDPEAEETEPDYEDDPSVAGNAPDEGLEQVRGG